MTFVSSLIDATIHFLGSIFHLVGIVLALVAVFKLVRAIERGDLTGHGLQGVLFLIIGMFCLSILR